MTSARKKFSESRQVLKEKIKTGISILQKYSATARIHYADAEIVKDLIYSSQIALVKVKKNRFIQPVKEQLIKKIEALLTIKSQNIKLTNVLIDVWNELTQPKYIEHPEFKIPPQQLNMKNIKWQTINKICFRGDDRKPKNIFLDGFEALEKDSLRADSEIVYMPFESNKSNIVAITSRFRAAICFPYDASVKATWVYVFKARKGFDVHSHGYQSYVEQGLNSKVAFGLFVEELITDKIPPEDIIAAVRVLRNRFDRLLNKEPEYFKDNFSRCFADFFDHCGEYTITDYKINLNCTLPQEERASAEEFIKNEMRANQKLMPLEKDEVAKYLIENQKILKEKGVTNKEIKFYLSHERQWLLSNSSKRKIKNAIKTYEESIQSGLILPVPTSGYHRNFLFKSAPAKKTKHNVPARQKNKP